MVAKGNASGINKEDAIYPLTRKVPIEDLTSYDYNPITYQIEKSIYVNPKNYHDEVRNISNEYYFGR